MKKAAAKTAKTNTKPEKKRVNRRHDGKNRYAFITQASMNGKPASEVAALAKKAGLGDIDPKYIYSCRSMATARAKLNGGSEKRKRGARAPAFAAGGGANGNNQRAFELLTSVAAEVGLGNAIAHLQAQRSRMQELVSGTA